MLSDEEKKAIEGIKKDDEYYDILENIKQNKYNMWNVEKLMRDTTTGDYTEYEIAQSIVYFVNIIEKQSKEIEELKEKKGYHLGFIDGGIAKKYEIQDKIKAKIEEVKDGTYDAKIVLQSLLEKEI